MAVAVASRSGARSRAIQRATTGYLFLLPALVLIATFTFYPFIRLIVLSFQSWDGVGLDTPWVGAANYQKVFADNIFWASVINVVTLGIALYFIGNGISLGMALAVNGVRRGGSFYRVVYYLPGIFSPVVVGLMFAWLLQPSVGLLNRGLGAVGLEMLQAKWLNDPSTALPSVAGVYIWYHWGFGFLLFLAGLQGVPRELYEAASIDGAGVWARFRHITWPQLIPITTIISVLTLSAALQIFATVQVMTNGGPGYLTEVPILRIYKEMLQNHRYGVAAAQSVIFGAMLVALSLAQIMIWRRQSGGSEEVE
jgi:multiple sugar transport system permease protein/raffinose/stachyose/melibiose transport system permease protein